MKRFIAWAFNRHTTHRADFEVCGDWLCRFAWWLERTFRPYGELWEYDR